ncbi:MAG: hypothetical protein AB3X44_01305 [Leptothrix sp. (in: b-proteobacteria)]
MLGQLLTVRRSIDVDIAALALLVVGLLGLAGACIAVSPDESALVWRAMSMAALMVILGLGLWHRQEWARRSAIVLAAYVVHAQLGYRWLQSDVPRVLLHGVRGVSMQTTELYSSALLVLPPPEVGPTAFCLTVCFGLGWLVLRLLSTRVQQEFGAGRSEVPARWPQKI